MRQLLTLIVFLSVSLLHAAGIGEWTYYFAYHDATQSIPVGKDVYALFNGNLLVYNTEDGEVREINKLNVLSGKQIVKMDYSAAHNTLVVLYADARVDLLNTSTYERMTLPQLANKYEDIVINDLTIVDSDALVATNRGLVHLDLVQQVIKGFYFSETPVRSAAIYDQCMYAATDQGMLRIELSKNLLDQSQWVTWNPLKIKYLKNFSGCLYIGLDSGYWHMYSPNQKGMFQLANIALKNVYVSTNGVVLYNEGATDAYILTAEQPEQLPAPSQFPHPLKAVSISRDATCWAAFPDGKLGAFQKSNDAFAHVGHTFGGYGPKRDICYNMHYVGERLLVAGGKLDPYDRTHFPGTVMSLENGQWTLFQEEGIAEATGGRYQDITRVVQHPSDPTLHIASAARVGLFVFRNGMFDTYYSIDNSPLVSAAADSKNYVRMDGLNYDAEGNLWMVNNQVDTTLVVLKADGTWQKLYYEPLHRAPTLEKTLFDSKGRLWVCSRRTVEFHDGGLFALDYNGTLSTDQDDIYKMRTTFINQDETSYTMNGAYCVAEDHDGRIWMGCNVGLFVIDDPDEWFNDDFRITQIKVPRNDGTNLADYLLSGTPVSHIAVDGANRKWIATENNGLYLVSADGVETIHHFTKENSPLPSNTVYSVAINHTTGEVMIGTDQGLVSYMSDASAPAEQLSESDLQIFPNPLRPEHQGSVTIKGLTVDADVKIATAGGQVIAGGTSLGGTWQWNGRTFAGKIAASGIYYVLVSTADGGTAIAGKILVVR